MLARVRSAAVLGIDAYLVDVETDIANGLPTFATVGLPQGAVKEGRERVYAALANTGYTFPLKRITVNLAPADIRKDGSAFDLPIAVGILAATEQISAERLGRVAVLGEFGSRARFDPCGGRCRSPWRRDWQGSRRSCCRGRTCRRRASSRGSACWAPAIWPSWPISWTAGPSCRRPGWIWPGSSRSGRNTTSTSGK